MSAPPSGNLSASSPRGQAVVIGMFLVAIAAAAFAWWWNFHRGQRALEFFGSTGATLVRTAPLVELRAEHLPRPIDLSHAPGLINARASLLSDASFEWEQPARGLQTPSLAVRFQAGQSSVELTFDFAERLVHTSSTNRTAKLTPKTAEGWQSYLSRQLRADR